MVPPKKATEEGREGVERERLRIRAERLVIQGSVPDGDHGCIPRALLKSDGADIVKRNTTRKKRYIMMFPGGLQINAGARIGVLDGLSTKTPRLTIECGEGRILLKGFLTFPKNCLILVKGGSSRTAVKVVDCFDAAVVFSEWSWVGNKEGNPGKVPEPLPPHIITDDGSVWQTSNKKPVVQNDPVVPRSSRHGLQKIESHGSISDEPDSSIENIIEGDIPLNDDDDWGTQVGVKLKGCNSERRRSNPSRKKREIDYSQMEIEDIDEIENNKSADLNGDKSGVVRLKIESKHKIEEESFSFDDEIQIVSSEPKESIPGGDHLMEVKKEEQSSNPVTPVKNLKRKQEPFLSSNCPVNGAMGAGRGAGRGTRRGASRGAANVKSPVKMERSVGGSPFQSKRSRALVSVLDENSDHKLEPDFIADHGTRLEGLVNKDEKVISRPKRRRSVVKYTQSSDEFSDANDNSASDNSASDYEKKQTRTSNAGSEGRNFRSDRSKNELQTLSELDYDDNEFNEAED